LLQAVSLLQELPGNLFAKPSGFCHDLVQLGEQVIKLLRSQGRTFRGHPISGTESSTVSWFGGADRQEKRRD
jgi:hypothetical protein